MYEKVCVGNILGTFKNNIFFSNVGYGHILLLNMMMHRKAYTINFMFAKHLTAKVKDPCDCMLRN